MNKSQQLEEQIKKVVQDGIIYSINEIEKTASAIDHEYLTDDVFIPRSIEYKSNEYIVKTISQKAFKKSCFNSLTFAPDSEIEIITKESFNESSIKSISIPSKVTKIEESAFKECYFLKKIEIPNDSNLKTIEKEAFAHTNIESFTIPSKLTELNTGWCESTYNLNKIIVSPDNPRYKSYDEGKLIIGKSLNEQKKSNSKLFQYLSKINSLISNEIENYDCLVFCSRDCEKIVIPKFIKHICSHAFELCKKLQEVIISDDSKLHSIGKNAFYGTAIENFIIPSKLTELEKGWCFETNNLNKIIVNPHNPLFKSYNNGKMIIGKSSIDDKNYDCLVFCARDIEKVIIPNFIRHICSNAFDSCNKIQEVIFPIDSKLLTIESCAFIRTSIKKITIPSTVTLIGEGAFFECRKLEYIEIPNNSNLKIIDDEAFAFTNINFIRIPSFVTQFGEHIFGGCPRIQYIEIANDSKLQAIYTHIFQEISVKQISIPSQVKIIEDHAFYKCFYLKKIEIPNDSNLISIGNGAFIDTSIETLSIPSQLINLDKNWCFNIRKLNKIIVSQDNPRYFCLDDKLIIGKSSIKQNNYNQLVFCVRNAKTITIPDYIEYICPYAFSNCSKLKTIHFSDNSKLQVIDVGAFELSSIESINIPLSVTQICENAFLECSELKKIEIENNSKLNKICRGVFQSTSIKFFKVPSKVTQICYFSFVLCEKLQIVEIDDDSELEYIDKKAFKCFNDDINTIFMISSKFGDRFINLKI